MTVPSIRRAAECKAVKAASKQPNSHPPTPPSSQNQGRSARHRTSISSHVSPRTSGFSTALPLFRAKFCWLPAEESTLKHQIRFESQKLKVEAYAARMETSAFRNLQTGVNTLPPSHQQQAFEAAI